MSSTFCALQILLTHAEPTLKFQKAYTSLVNKELTSKEILYIQQCFPEIKFADSKLSEENLNKLLAAIQQRLNEIENAENIVFVLGNTGSCKSTLINHLSNLPLVYDEDETGRAFVDVDANHKSLIKIGYNGCSQTLLPEIVKSQGFSFVECPHPIAGFEEQLEFSYFVINTAIARAKNTYAALLLIDASVFSSPQKFVDSKVVNTLFKLKDMYSRHHSSADINKESELPILFTISRPPVPGEGKGFDVSESQNQVMHRINEKAKHRKESIDELKAVLQQGHDKLKLIDLVFNEIDETDLEALKYAIKFVEKLHPSTAYYNPYKDISNLIYVSHGEKLDTLKVKADLLRYRKYAVDDIEKLDYELKYQMIFAELIKRKMIYVSRGFSTNQKDTADHKDDLIKALRAVPFMKGFDVAVSSSGAQAHSYRLFSTEQLKCRQLQLAQSNKTEGLVASVSSFTPSGQENKLSPR